MSAEEAQALVRRALAASKADEAQVRVSSGSSSHLRFARNTPSTSGTETGPAIAITSSFGRRSGTVSVNQLDEKTVASAVARSEEIARLAPEDPEHMPGLPAQEYRAVDAWDEATATEGATHMAQGVGASIKAAASRDLVAAGFTRTTARAQALGNSRGLFAYHRQTTAAFSVTMRTADAAGSGWAGRASRRIGELDYAGASEIAAEKAATSRGARALQPGKYVTILEPACVADMLGLLVRDMDMRRADEGRSYFSRVKLGERMFGKAIDIRSDPSDARCPSRAWNEEGLPQAPRAWVDHGKLGAFGVDRFWAAKKNVEPVARPANMLMAGGQGTLADLIKSTKRGVLVTSLWYIRSVDPQTLLNTGLTRDGVFWIENGAIAYPVNNFRWNESPIAVLKNIEAMSEAQRVPGRGDTQPRTIVPALKVKQFTFSSVSDAV